MKKGIHPKLHKNAKVTDLSSGNTFVIPSTKEEITVEVTNLSHPFYTGKHRIVDTENLVKKFEKKRGASNKDKVVSKKQKQLKRNAKVNKIEGRERMTLKDMLKQMQ